MKAKPINNLLVTIKIPSLSFILSLIHISEVDCQDVWQKAVIGVAVVSNDTRHAEEMLEHITHFMEEFSVEMELIQVDIELL